MSTPVDVLAVIDKAAADLGFEGYSAGRIHEARDVVAELVEAGNALLHYPSEEAHERLRAALAKAQP